MISLLAAALIQSVGPSASLPAATPAQWAMARRALDASMIDYPSARFRDVGGHSFAICGLVNAKNWVGGYTGWTRFAVFVDDDEPLVQMGEGDAVMIDLFCTGERAPVIRQENAARLAAPARR